MVGLNVVGFLVTALAVGLTVTVDGDPEVLLSVVTFLPSFSTDNVGDSVTFSYSMVGDPVVTFPWSCPPILGDSVRFPSDSVVVTLL